MIKCIPLPNKDNDISKNNHKKRILLVDDDEDVNITLKKVLEMDDRYDVDSFSNPLYALEYFKRDRYDLIILDIKMPQMNGFEFYTEIQKIDIKVKVCFLTAGEINYGKDYERLSKNLFLRKPIENDVLLKAIENIIGS